MLERQLGHIKPDMDVCDVTGDKVGHIAHVYRYTEVPLGVGGAANAAVSEGRPLEDGVMEVKTGFLGLGSHLYIPFSAVQETLSDCVFVAKAKEEFARLGWQDKPLYFDRLSQTE
jgi:hypothetical protein